MSTTQSTMINLWEQLSSTNQKNNCSSSFLNSSLETSAKNVNWLITNRGGLADLAGLALVPSQYACPGLSISRKAIDALCKKNEDNEIFVEKISHPCEDDLIYGIICYPKGWDIESDNSRCILYHNPNAITVSEYFKNQKLFFTPYELMTLYKCPVILYDYRGTGLSQGSPQCSSLSFRPTYESVVLDGLSMTSFACERFSSVNIWGSSLGGGVATIALDRHLKRTPEDSQKITLTNHDSFSTTPRVVFPKLGFLMNKVGSLIGANLDAETSMHRLLSRNVRVLILCHEEDPVIPSGARMVESFSSSPYSNLSIITIPKKGHANLSDDMIEQIIEKGWLQPS